MNWRGLLLPSRLLEQMLRFGFYMKYNQFFSKVRAGDLGSKNKIKSNALHILQYRFEKSPGQLLKPQAITKNQSYTTGCRLKS